MQRQPLKKDAMSKHLPSIHPGEVLLEEFLKPMNISQYRLAKDAGIPPMRVSEIVRGKRAATAIIDLRSSPGNRLAKLSGGRNGQWSIRINQQWRICFQFENGHAMEVEIVDYH